MVISMTTKPRTATDIFLELVGSVARDQWEGRLAELCCGDDQLERRVRALLHAHAEPASFLEHPALGDIPLDSDASPICEGPGTLIGPYKLIEEIGEGGFGVVFLAEQSAPVRRRVALKIIKPGMDTRQVIARFEAERQALAMMDHPNIAKVFDAGTTGEGARDWGLGTGDERRTSSTSAPSPQPVALHAGRPYFVMELVQGVPITDYCDQCNLATHERLELFDIVCQAVQHAHQKGVIHRDIKPSNVLVAIQDGLPTPKIIDFGVAKAINERLTDRSLMTGFTQMLGTPLYMSPEQAELSPLGVDTRSDIYSLGVLLYELLTGSTPFDKERLQAAPYDQMRHIICDEEPPKPSARLSTLANELASTIAAQRRTDTRRLQQHLRGDLDWIVMKCLEKDRNRRYETASALADDVRHYLQNEPVIARPPSRLYRAGKFVRRNKAAVVASAAVLLSLVAGIVGTTIGLVSQSRQREIAERQRAEAQLNYAMARQSQGNYGEAEALYRKELELPTSDTSADRQRIALLRLRLAETVNDTHGAADGEPLFREALVAHRAAFPPNDTNIAYAASRLGYVLRTRRQFAEAEQLFREAYDIHRRAASVDHRAIGEFATILANVLITLGRYAEAETFAREAVAAQLQAKPLDVWGLAHARLELGRNLLAMGKFADAEAVLIQAERALAETPGFPLGNIAMVALYTRWNEAEPGKGYNAKAQEWFRNLIGMFVPLEPPDSANSER
jgi:serine/threonine protein kinase/tetratricopeptide (TPR) repeat protein